MVASPGYRLFVSSAITPILTEWPSTHRRQGGAVEAEMALAIMDHGCSWSVIDPQLEQYPRSVRRFVDRRSYAPETEFLAAVADQRRIGREDIVELSRRITSLTAPEKRSASSSASHSPKFATRFPYDPLALDHIVDLVDQRPVDDADAVSIAAEVLLTVIAKHPFIDGNGRTARLLSLHVLERHFGLEKLDLPLGVVSSANMDTMASAVRRRLEGDPCADFPTTFAAMLVVALTYVGFATSKQYEPIALRQAIREGVASGPSLRADHAFARLFAKYGGLIDDQG